MDVLREFCGPNAGYVLELYDRFLADPNSVDEETKGAFQTWGRELAEAISWTSSTSEKTGQGRVASEGERKTILSVASLAHDIRQFGHLAAHLDPLGLLPESASILRMDSYRLTNEILKKLPADIVSGPVVAKSGNALEAIETLMDIYTSTVGFDFEHVHDVDERTWLRDVIECREFSRLVVPVDEKSMLEKLTQVEVFEQFLQRSFPGKFRFSIEGVDMLVPMLGELVTLATHARTKSLIIGMAHRGRLNVLAHILQLPYAAIFAEFRDPARHRNSRVDLDWTGDVKYHLGGFRIQQNSSPKELEILLAPNPSHLEAIDPVIEGMARASGTDAQHGGKPKFDPSITLPVLIHGDASFPGQGIVAETLNFSRLDGYSTGGTIHIITNNQLGYTALPSESRSTRYASDLAKGFEIPIVHVNADDPEACIETIRIASAYREKFHKDFLIDLVGYRRHGHNESDEPTFTQPLMYERIQGTPTVRQKWAKTLEQRNIIQPDEAARLVKTEFDRLQSVLSSLEPDKALIETRPVAPPSGIAKRVKTQVPLERLKKLNEELLTFPDGFSIHPKLVRSVEKRRVVFDNPDSPTIDWAAAELFALSSIIQEGIPIRFSGQDSDRGTFSHRHLTYHDIKNGNTFNPLQSLRDAKAGFEIYNSPLTENAAIGFEYGYNVQEPERLVIWEAQYGDFINNAQIMVDEFITSARAKWGQTTSVVLLLPHAYEGQGPDHSSGRLERYLELAAETNIRVANCTTSAQYFHLLRRQALVLKTDPLPLVVMTPKGLLRHPHTASTPRDLVEGKWRSVIDDPDTANLRNKTERLILCSGKVFVDLMDSELRRGNDRVAVVRIEQLYPFPADELRDAVKGYKRLKEIVWVQEEPENMGALNYIRPLLQDLFGAKLPINYISRTRNASPAEGSTALHIAHQKEIIERAYGWNLDAVEAGSAEVPSIGELVPNRQSVNEVNSTGGNSR